MPSQETLINLTNYYLDFIEQTKPQNIDISNLEKVYDDLIQIINFHNDQYYIKSLPIISDYQYDKLFEYLKKIEELYPFVIKDYSPTQKLTYQVQTEFGTAYHIIPMLSLENTYNCQDLKDWQQSIKKILEKQGYTGNISYIIQPKYDGLSIDLVYKNGQFKQAITRGDGLIGEDVTENVKTIKNIPKKIDLDDELKKLEIRIRGEIILPKSSLERINQERQKQGLKIFANTRNAASGSVRQLDPNITAQRGLKFFAYDFIVLKDKIQLFDIQIDLCKLGFETVSIDDNVYSDIDDIITQINQSNYIEKIKNYDIDFDGLVIKISDINVRKILGYTQHHVRWAVAYKFQAQQISTQIISVEFSVGRTGIITPVAKLKPVKIGGVTVSNASLHNFDFIKSKDIRVGDYVWVQRSGEVIPYVLGVIIDQRTKDTKPINPPINCPVCGNAVIKLDDEVFYYCGNINCPAIIKEKLNHFVSKDCMNIEGFGERLIDMLVDASIINDFSDIYKLNSLEKRILLKSLPLIGDKKLSQLLQNIEKSKQTQLRRLIHGIGIRYVGKKTAQMLSEKFLEKFDGNWQIGDLIGFLTDQNQLKQIYGIGNQTIFSIVAYLSQPQNIDILSKLIDVLNFKNIVKVSNIVEGLHFCITGKFDIPRQQIVQILEKNGAIYDTNPTKHTNFMLVGQEPGSKLLKAQNLGIQIVNGLNELSEIYGLSQDLFKNIKQTISKPKSLGLF